MWEDSRERPNAPGRPRRLARLIMIAFLLLLGTEAWAQWDRQQQRPEDGIMKTVDQLQLYVVRYSGIALLVVLFLLVDIALVCGRLRIASRQCEVLLSRTVASLEQMNQHLLALRQAGGRASPPPLPASPPPSPTHAATAVDEITDVTPVPESPPPLPATPRPSDATGKQIQW